MRIPLRTLALSVAVAALAGCGVGGSSATQAVAANTSIAGNWTFATAAAPATAGQIAAVGGALLVSGTTIGGVLHTLPGKGQTAASLCYAPASAIAVSGSMTAANAVTLTSSSFGGSTLTLRGTYVAGSNSLSGATLSIAGTCAVATQAASGVHMQAIAGSYHGSFVSDSGPSVAVAATLTQTTQPDANGTYHLSGSATFPADGCIASSVVSDSSVTGNAFSATYTDATSHATVVASGTFDTAASTLTIDSYVLSGAGGCTDTGHGLLSQ